MPLLAFVLSLPMLAAAGASESAGSERLGDSHAVTLFSLRVGEQIAYAGQIEEQAEWGPAGLAVSEDGTIWIADGARHRLVGFDRAGAETGVIDLDEDLVGIGGIATHGQSLVVLDIAAIEPAVLVVDAVTGDVARTITLPRAASLERGLSGVSVGDDGLVCAELEGGLRHVEVARISSVTARGLAVEETSASVRFAQSTELGDVRVHGADEFATGGGARLDIGGRSVSIETENLTGTVRAIGSDDSALYVSVDEVSQHPDGSLVVDATVRAYDADGRQVGIVRVPPVEVPAGPYVQIAATPDGAIIALVPRERTVDVVELKLERSA